MIVTPIPSSIESWIAERVAAPRSRGFHVSVLVLGMLKEIAPKTYGDYGKAPEARQAIYELGYLWEDLLGAVLDARVMLADHEHLLSQQVEIQRNTDAGAPVYGTPDRIVLAPDGDPIVEETKITWKWYSDDLEQIKFLYWVLQVKTYCAMIGATRARVRALFVNEISHADRFVAPGCWEIMFTPLELMEWWTSISGFAAAHPELEYAA